MLKDEEYIRQTRRLILSEREKMYSALKEQPAYKTYKPYANFLLVKLLQKETTAFDVFTHCVKNGLMIRDCSSFKSLDGEIYPVLCYGQQRQSTSSRRTLFPMPSKII